MISFHTKQCHFGGGFGFPARVITLIQLCAAFNVHHAPTAVSEFGLEKLVQAALGGGGEVVELVMKESLFSGNGNPSQVMTAADGRMG